MRNAEREASASAIGARLLAARRVRIDARTIGKAIVHCLSAGTNPITTAGRFPLGVARRRRFLAHGIPIRPILRPVPSATAALARVRLLGRGQEQGDDEEKIRHFDEQGGPPLFHTKVASFRPSVPSSQGGKTILERKDDEHLLCIYL
jgi:hypothetical protein